MFGRKRRDGYWTGTGRSGCGRLVGLAIYQPLDMGFLIAYCYSRCSAGGMLPSQLACVIMYNTVIRLDMHGLADTRYDDRVKPEYYSSVRVSRRWGTSTRSRVASPSHISPSTSPSFPLCQSDPHAHCRPSKDSPHRFPNPALSTISSLPKDLITQTCENMTGYLSSFSYETSSSRTDSGRANRTEWELIYIPTRRPRSVPR
jgi:hypothetical protein